MLPHIHPPPPGQVEAVDGRGCTALHCALMTSRGDVVEAVALLLQRGASANSRDDRGATPLHYAGDSEMMALLMVHGAEVDARDNRCRTPLIWAVAGIAHRMREAEQEVRFLTGRGADPNAFDAEGRSALSYAAGASEAGAVEALLQAGASVGGEAAGTRLVLEAVASADDLEMDAEPRLFHALLDAGARVSLDAALAFAEHAARVAAFPQTDDRAAVTARLLGAATRTHEEAEDARVAGKLAAALAAAVEADRRDVASGLHALVTGAAAEARRLEAARAVAAAESAAAAAAMEAAAAERAELLRLRAEVAALQEASRAAAAAAGAVGTRQRGGDGSSQGAAQPRAKRARGAAN
jgi:uncharacterized protein